MDRKNDLPLSSYSVSTESEQPSPTLPGFLAFGQHVELLASVRALELDNFSVFDADSTPVYLVSECF